MPINRPKDKANSHSRAPSFFQLREYKLAEVQSLIARVCVVRMATLARRSAFADNYEAKSAAEESERDVSGGRLLLKSQHEDETTNCSNDNLHIPQNIRLCLHLSV